MAGIVAAPRLWGQCSSRAPVPAPRRAQVHSPKVDQNRQDADRHLHAARV